MTEEYSLLLGGKRVETGDLLTVNNPYTGDQFAAVHRAGEKEVEASILTGKAGFESMRSLPLYRRSDILNSCARLLEENGGRFAVTMAMEAGKPLRAARAEVERAIFTFRIGASEAGRVIGEDLPLDLVPWGEGARAIVRRCPIGTILAITPFNFPLNLVVHKLSPAIASGNSIILKPSSETPVTSLMLAELLYEAGLPEKALSVLPMASTLAPLLVSDPRLSMVSFTGSPVVGWPLKGLAGKKRVTLELGGNAAVIVHNDADVKEAAARCVAGGYGYSGQSCISVQRIFIHRDIYEEFRREFVEGVESLKSGDPEDEQTDVGPLITEAAALQVESLIRASVEKGGRLLCGGDRSCGMIEPAVLEDVDRSMDLYRKEIFGPVTVIYPYDTFPEALEAVNDSDFGLQAGLFTHDVRLIHQAFDTLEVGGLVVNQSSAYRIDHQPYGGVKDSGFGREGVRYAMEEMTEQKILIYA